MLKKPMFIYVSGPYSSPTSETDEAKKREIIEKNINIANEAALALVRKGHIPFVPHTMMRGWEDIHQVPRELALEICHRWVEKCDALYFIAPSNGAESERQIAISLDMPVYYNLDEIDTLNTDFF
jgi:hypothetical protein